MPIGPQLPPKAEKRKRSDENEREDSDDSDDSTGPLPPSDNVEDSKVKKTRVVGPSLPPSHIASEKKTDVTADSKDDESSDDDGFGPSLPPPPGSKSKLPTESQSEAQKKSATAAVPPKVQRDEWMTMAPSSGDWSQRIDPTKLKNRKFNTGRSTNASSSGSDIWNETPEQKQARLRREVLGIKSQKGEQKVATSTASEDTETARRMKEYNSQRGPSLYEAHQKGKTIEEDDPSARAFDREKDIAGGLQINATQRREMVKKSSDFNSRFSSAKYL